MEPTYITKSCWKAKTHIKCSIHKMRVPRWDQIQAWLCYIMGLLDFHASYKKYLVFIYNTLASGLWLLLNPLSNDLVHTMPWQCMFTLSLSLCVCVPMVNLTYSYSTISSKDIKDFLNIEFDFKKFPIHRYLCIFLDWEWSLGRKY